MTKKAILVLGMHRSGTSALTGALAHMGVAMPRTEMTPQPDNPKGFFESLAIMGVCEDILATAGSAWDDWRELNTKGLDKKHITKVLQVVQDEFGDSPVIGLKDPRICRMADLWISVLEGAGYEVLIIIPYRHPLEVAQSICARNYLPLPQSLLLWLRHVLDAELATRNYPRAFVSMLKLLEDWRVSLTTVAQKLDLPLLDPKDRSDVDMEQHLDISLKRQNVDMDVLETLPELKGWVRTTFIALENLKTGANIKDAQKALDTVRKQLNEATVLFGPALAASEDRIRELEPLAHKVPDLQALIDDSLGVRHVLDFTLKQKVAELEMLQSQFNNLEVRVKELSAALIAKDELYHASVAVFEAAQIRFDEARTQFSLAEAAIHTSHALVVNNLKIGHTEERAQWAARMTDREVDLQVLRDKLHLYKSEAAKEVALRDKLLDSLNNAHSAERDLHAKHVEVQARSYEVSLQQLQASDDMEIARLTNRHISERVQWQAENYKLDRALQSALGSLQIYRKGRLSDYLNWTLNPNKRL